MLPLPQLVLPPVAVSAREFPVAEVVAQEAAAAAEELVAPEASAPAAAVLAAARALLLAWEELALPAEELGGEAAVPAYSGPEDWWALALVEAKRVRPQSRSADLR